MRHSLLVTASFIGLVAANPAYAAVYSYTANNGDVLTVDTVRMTGSLIGTNIHATFSGQSLASFDGSGGFPRLLSSIRIDPGSWLEAEIPGGDLVRFQVNYNIAQTLETGLDSPTTIKIWTFWGSFGCPNCNYKGAYSTNLPANGGGTRVPEPGMAGLVALGLAGAYYARRRAIKVRLALKPISE